MAQVVGQLMIEMAANVARLQTDMAKATKTVDGAMAKIQKSVEVAKKALGGLVGIEVINRIGQATKAAIDMADGLGELAEKTGMSVKELSSLRVAFQLNGLQADQVAGAMKKLSVSVAKGADAFAAMGINTKNVDGTLKNTRQILGEVADRFASYRDGAAKTALAVNLFGKAGGDMVLLLNQGAAGLARFDEEARKLGIALDDDAAAAAGRFNDELDKLGFVVDAAWLRFSSQLLPVLESTVTYLRNSEQQTTIFSGALDGLALAIKSVYSIFVGFGFVLESAGKFMGNLVATLATLATDGVDAARKVKDEFKADFAADLEKAANAINNAWGEIPKTIQTTGDAANDAAKKNAPAIKTLNKEIDAQGKAYKTAANQTKVYADAHIKAYEAYKKGSKAAEDLIDNIKYETTALKMSNEARAVANELRELEKTGLDTTSAAYKKYAAEVIKATTGREAVRKQIEEQEAARQRWTDLWADVGRSLTDSLMEGGKNAKEYLEGTFKAMILRPQIEAFVNATIQSATGSAIGGSIMGSATASAIGTWLGPVMVAMAGLAIWRDIGRQISKGMDIGGGALGEGLDFIFGGTLSRAFGKGPYKLRSERLQGELTAGGADLDIVRRLKREGGVFRGDDRRTIVTALEGEVLAGINKAIADMTKVSKSFAETMGISGDALADFVYNVDLDFKGLKPEEKQEKLAQLMVEFNDAIARQLIPNIDSLKRDGETAAQALERLAANMQAVNGVMDLLNQSLYETSVAGAQLSTGLIDAFGGLEAFTQATGVFYDKFFTDTEKFTNTTDMLAREFAKLGLSVPATREEYRRLVEAQNRFTAEGAATYAQLVKLSGAFASVTDEVGAAATALNDTMAGLLTNATNAAADGLRKQIEATRDLAAQSRDMARAYADAATAIRATAQGLMFGRTGAPQSVLRQQYQSTLQMALGGDLAALQGVGGAASALVESVRGTATSRVDFIRQAAVVQAQLEETARVADAVSAAADYQAELLTTNVAILDATLKALESGNLTNTLLQDSITAIERVTKAVETTASLNVNELVALKTASEKGALSVVNGVVTLDKSTGNGFAANATILSAIQKLNGDGNANSALNFANVIKSTNGITTGANTNATSANGLLNSLNLSTIGVKDGANTNTIGINKFLEKINGTTGGITTAVGNNTTKTVAELFDIFKQAEKTADISEYIQDATQGSETLLTLVQASIDSSATSSANIVTQLQAGNNQVAGLLAQILAATKKQTEADAAAAEAAAKAEAERQAEIARQQALAAEAARKQQEVEALKKELANLNLKKTGAALDTEIADIINLLNAFIKEGPALGLIKTDIDSLISSVRQYEDIQKRIAVAREFQKSMGMTPAFADGGMHSGGLRLVGENGPELEATGPARIYSARQTAGMLAGGADMVAELRLLRQEVGELRYEARATATNTNKTQRLLERVTLDGEAMQTVAYS